MQELERIGTLSLLGFLGRDTCADSSSLRDATCMNGGLDEVI